MTLGAVGFYLLPSNAPQGQLQEIWLGPHEDFVAARTITSRLSDGNGLGGRRRSYPPRQIELTSDQPFSAVLIDLLQVPSANLPQVRESARQAILGAGDSNPGDFLRSAFVVRRLKWKLSVGLRKQRSYLLLVGPTDKQPGPGGQRVRVCVDYGGAPAKEGMIQH